MLKHTSSSRTSGPHVTGFFDPRTFSIQYVVADPETRRCAIIDPILDYEKKSAAIATPSADALLAFIDAEKLEVEWIFDTHPHADHLTAMDYLKGKTGARTGTGARVVDMQSLWRDWYNLGAQFKVDGSQWDHLLEAGETLRVGELDGRVMFSPGHTLASATLVVGDAAFVHDTLFMPDSGTARADFPGGDARALWRSVQDILILPEATRVFTGHDYQPKGRLPLWESTVREQVEANVHLGPGQTEEGFTSLRTTRDATLPMPKLILHALQVNIVAGRLPEPERNGRRYFKIPLNSLGRPAWN